MGVRACEVGTTGEFEVAAWFLHLFSTFVFDALSNFGDTYALFGLQSDDIAFWYLKMDHDPLAFSYSSFFILKNTFQPTKFNHVSLIISPEEHRSRLQVWCSFSERVFHPHPTRNSTTNPDSCLRRSSHPL
jgi:hypothetical protein